MPKHRMQGHMSPAGKESLFDIVPFSVRFEKVQFMSAMASLPPIWWRRWGAHLLPLATRSVGGACLTNSACSGQPFSEMRQLWPRQLFVSCMYPSLPGKGRKDPGDGQRKSRKTHTVASREVNFLLSELQRFLHSTRPTSALCPKEA